MSGSRWCLIPPATDHSAESGSFRKHLSSQVEDVSLVHPFKPDRRRSVAKGVEAQKCAFDTETSYRIESKVSLRLDVRDVSPPQHFELRLQSSTNSDSVLAHDPSNFPAPFHSGLVNSSSSGQPAKADQKGDQCHKELCT